MSKRVISRRLNEALDNALDVGHLLEQIPLKNRAIMFLLFFENWTLEEVGFQFGLTRERIRQIREESLELLRRVAKRKRFAAVPRAEPEAAAESLAEVHEFPTSEASLLEERPFSDPETVGEPVVSVPDGPCDLDPYDDVSMLGVAYPVVAKLRAKGFNQVSDFQRSSRGKFSAKFPPKLCLITIRAMISHGVWFAEGEAATRELLNGHR